MYYIQFDRIANYNYKKFIKIGLFIISFAILLSGIIYIYISNNSNTSNIHNTRRKIDKIEYDITNLYNYTETMSEFMVDNYKPSINNIEDFNNETLKKQDELILNIKEFKKELINETLKKQDELIKDIKEFKNELINDINEFKLENYNLQNNFRKLTLRIIAIEYILTKYNGFDRNNWFAVYGFSSYSENSKNIQSNLTTTIYNYFEKFLNIDYENYIISFNYYSNNERENIIKNPIYNIIRTALYSEYDYINNSIDKNFSHYDIDMLQSFNSDIGYINNPSYYYDFRDYYFINIVLICDEMQLNHLNKLKYLFHDYIYYNCIYNKNIENNKLIVINKLENYEFEYIKKTFWIKSIEPMRFM